MKKINWFVLSLSNVNWLYHSTENGSEKKICPNPAVIQINVNPNTAIDFLSMWPLSQHCYTIRLGKFEWQKTKENSSKLRIKKNRIFKIYQKPSKQNAKFIDVPIQNLFPSCSSFLTFKSPFPWTKKKCIWMLCLCMKHNPQLICNEFSFSS